MNTLPKKYAFVVMPFEERFSNTYNYAIKLACKNTDVFCQRLDEQIFTGGMLDQIYVQINKSDFIIADMSARNPNVFYEVGYAHALNKTVILITNNAEDIPFDLKHYQHIVYNENKLEILQKELEKKIKFLKSTNNVRIESSFSKYILTVDGKKLEQNQLLTIDSLNTESIQVNFDFHNPTASYINAQDEIVCVTIEKRLVNRSYSDYPVLPDDKILVNIGRLPSIMPYGYESLLFSIDKNEKLDKMYFQNNEIQLNLKIFTKTETFELPFFYKELTL